MRPSSSASVTARGDGGAHPPAAGTVSRVARFFVCNFQENDMLTGGLLWLIGIPIPVILLIWFFFLRGR